LQLVFLFKKRPIYKGFSVSKYIYYNCNW